VKRGENRFEATASISICVFTTDETEAALFRLFVAPSERNGLRSASRLMVDKLTTVSKERLGTLIGRPDDEDEMRLNRLILVFLDMA
jgi:mRNA interferase MazF